MSILTLLLAAQSNPTPGGVGPVTVPAAASPLLLTYEQQSITEIDIQGIHPSYVHLTNDFATVTGLTTYTGTPATINAGKLQFTGSYIGISSTAPLASWFCVELTIDAMQSAGTNQKLGPAFAYNGGAGTGSSGYVAAVYDCVANKVEIIQNDVVLFSYSKVLNPVGLTLYFGCSGKSFYLLAKEAGGEIEFMGQINGPYDFRADNTASLYRYGVFCEQTGAAATHTATLLRGGASGGFGCFNQAMVTDDRGYPVHRDGKLLMTGDLGGIGGSYMAANNCLWELDVDAGTIEIVGRYYMQRDPSYESVGFVGGGQDMKMMYIIDEDRFLCTYVACDGFHGILDHSDKKFYVDYADAFTEHVIPYTAFTVIDVATAVKLYDVDLRVIDGESAMLAQTHQHPINYIRMYRGADVDSMDTMEDHSDGGFFELGRWARFNNTNYCTFSRFANIGSIPVEVPGNFTVEAMSYPAFTYLGEIPMPYVDARRVPGGFSYVKQEDGKSYYYFVMFDTYPLMVTDAGGTPMTFDWAIGRLVIMKAVEFSIGYEYPTL